jgi:hypothetical protein
LRIGSGWIGNLRHLVCRENRVVALFIAVEVLTIERAILGNARDGGEHHLARVVLECGDAGYVIFDRAKGVTMLPATTVELKLVERGERPLERIARTGLDIENARVRRRAIIFVGD